jgi:hypothetical protein
MSEVKVNKISPRTNCGTVQLGDSGDTITIPAGATIVNNGTQTGFGRTGTVDWDTTAKTASFTAVSGNGYFVNTTSGAVTMTLPASPSAGDIVAVADYANTFQTNNLTIAPNSSPINGVTQNYTASTEGISLTFVYVDGTRGWKNINDGTTDASGVPPFIVATGGTITCCGDFKIHTFTGPGTFTVTNAGNPSGSDTVDYLIIAGGGGSTPSTAGPASGGAGGGGYRESKSGLSGCWTASPLATPTGITVSATSYPIVVGAGGTVPRSPGSPSSGLGITSTGGGEAGIGGAGGNGGSGGGGGGGPTGAGGSGNTPPVSPPQGNNGGNGDPSPPNSGGGGGGAGGGGDSGNAANSGDSGPGTPTNFTGTPIFYSAGGVSIGHSPTSPGSATCGAVPVGTPGTANRGTGGPTGTTGGSGIVVIRYKYQ